jgi:hypothetical protein
MARRLRTPGPQPAQIVRSLRDVAQKGHDVGGIFHNYAAEALINAYVAWVNEIERTLRQYFVDPNIEALYTPRFFNIWSSGGYVPRLSEVVVAEASWQAAQLDALADDLEATSSRLSSTPATLGVVDTNVFLHCVPLEDIDWSFVASGSVRIVVPLRVVEELDNKKRDRNPDIARRARQRVRWLHDTLVSTVVRAPLKGSATIEVFVPDGYRSEQPSADTEILEDCETLAIFTSQPVKVVTSDLGMQLRSIHYRHREGGFEVAEIPPIYRLDSNGGAGG